MQLTRLVAQTQLGQWAVKDSAVSEPLAVHREKQSAIQHAIYDLDQNQGGGDLVVYGEDGRLERREHRSGLTFMSEARSAAGKANDGLGILGIILMIVTLLVPSFATSFFSPKVAENADNLLGVIVATFTWSMAIFAVTLYTVLREAGCLTAVIMFGAAIVVTSMIAGLVGLDTMSWSEIIDRSPAVGWAPARLFLGALVVAVYTYGVGGTLLGATVGIASGIWLGSRVRKSYRKGESRGEIVNAPTQAGEQSLFVGDTTATASAKSSDSVDATAEKPTSAGSTGFSKKSSSGRSRWQKFGVVVATVLLSAMLIAMVVQTILQF